ncbi:MAG: hypothetical protein HYY06_00315 [Deltaproteobacteria bacterium]|nr:hypothetical protein [Deltaproteobacteria bacterium]
MSTRVEVFASPGWEAEVDTDWAEGLFAVFLRSARGRRRGPKGTTKVISPGDVSDGVILLTVRKEGAQDGAGAAVADGDDTTPRGSKASDTRRSKRPRKVDERTAKLSPEALARSRSGTGRKSRGTGSRHAQPPAPPPPARPMTLRAAVPPPAPTRSQTTRRAATPAPPARQVVPPPGPTQKIERPTVPAAEPGRGMPSEGIGAFFAEMATLVKYGHVAQVRSEVDRMLVQWPDDLRVRGLIIDFFREKGLISEAIDGLFGLATVHFDRREMSQMRLCLDEVLRLDPDSRRARRMRELLDRRPGRPRPG